jgi:FRG domain
MAVKAIEVIDRFGDSPFKAREFLDYMRLSNDQWWSQENGVENQQWVFRGVSDAKDHHLLPTGLRKLEPHSDDARKIEHCRLFNRVKKSMRAVCANCDESKFQTDLRAITMDEGVESFIREAREFGHKFSNYHGHLYKSILTDGYCCKNFSSDMTGLHHDAEFAIAQHHGIPTFLLDWTYNSLVATFFACEGWDEKKSKDVAVWCFNDKLRREHAPAFIDPNKNPSQSNIDSYNAFGSQLIKPQYGENEYIRAQSGAFTWISGEYDLEGKNWLGADQIMAESKSDAAFVKKIVLQACELPALKELLNREGISRARLMPTLDNIALTARGRW